MNGLTYSILSVGTSEGDHETVEDKYHSLLLTNLLNFNHSSEEDSLII